MPGYVPFRCPRCGCNLTRVKARVEEAQKDYPNAFTPWSKADDVKLKDLYQAGTPIDQIAEALGRQDTAILKRVAKRQLERGGQAGGTQAGEPCPGPHLLSWVSRFDDPHDAKLQPHAFQRGAGTACAFCTYDPTRQAEYELARGAALASPVASHAAPEPSTKTKHYSARAVGGAASGARSRPRTRSRSR